MSAELVLPATSDERSLFLPIHLRCGKRCSAPAGPAIHVAGQWRGFRWHCSACQRRAISGRGYGQCAAARPLPAPLLRRVGNPPAGAGAASRFTADRKSLATHRVETGARPQPIAVSDQGASVMDGARTERQRVRRMGRRRIRSVTGITAMAGTLLAAVLGVVFAGAPETASAGGGSGLPGPAAGPVVQPVAATGSSGSGLLPVWGQSRSRHGVSSSGGIAAPTQSPGTSAGGASHAGSGAS
jgi:hypothetical protein